MEVALFNGKTYGKENTQLYVFEETWDTFRPITKVEWNGKKFAINDRLYKQNLFDTHYGFGSLEMKNYCKVLTENTELNGPELDPLSFWKWCGTSTEWFCDRPCVLSSCGNHDWKKYVAYTGSRPKTLRRAPSSRITRRLVVKRVKM
jgi:hypothetical protein